MKFCHVVHINDPKQAPARALTFEQVWRGLVLKAENPLLFVEALDEFRLLSRDAQSVRRELRFGTTTIRDRIILLPPDRMRHEIEASDMVPGATLCITVEQSSGAQLGVRFDYETSPSRNADADQTIYQDFVRQAYVEADTHTIEVIRRLAGAGEL